MVQRFALFCFAPVAIGVSLHSEVSMMRREVTELGSHGEMMLRKHMKMQGKDTCDDIFIPGTEGQEACKDPATQKRIDGSMKELCVIAAGEHAASSFEIHFSQYHEHPAGCFINNGKYFFNPVYKASNQTLVGIPVCITTTFSNGTAGSNACPDTYENIVDEDECRFAASCLSRCAEGQFRDLTEAEQEQYPIGCHIRGDDRCYAFNNKTVAPAEKKSVEGTPVCRSTSAPPYTYQGSSLVAISDRALIMEGADDVHADNPCSYVGCNSAKCEWASGGRIRRVVASKGCSNALVLGSGDGSGASPSHDGKPMVQIQTLKQCMNAVKARQDDACSGHFQLHKETWTCSCVPSGSTCAEQEDEKVCRFEVVE